MNPKAVKKGSKSVKWSGNGIGMQLLNIKLGSSTSISKNLSVSLVLVLITVITIVVLSHGMILSRTAKRDLGNKADELLANLQKSVELPIWNFDQEALNKIVEAYFLSSLVSQISVTEGYSREMIIEKRNPDDKELIIRECDIMHQGDVIAHIKIGLTKKYYKMRLKRLIASYLFTAIALIFIFILVTGILLRVFLKNPFDDLIHGLERISAGDYSYRLSQVRYKELSVIVHSFEHMADQIKEREKSLNSAKNYIADIFNSIDSILVGLDIQGRVTHWNTQAEEFTKTPFKAAIGQHFVQLFPYFKKQSVLIERALEKKMLQRDLKVKVRGESGIEYYSISVSPLSSEVGIGAVVRINDLSERVRLEEMMIQTEKMLSVGGLAAGMAHEINNPLSGILQNAQVIQNRLSSATLSKNIMVAEKLGVSVDAIRRYMEERQVLELLTSVREAGVRASRIVDNMLSFSRKSNSSFSYYDIRTIVDETIELASNDYDLKKNYDFRSIAIKRGYGGDLQEVLCDATKIQQVILNILKNGAHAMIDNVTGDEAPCFVILIRQIMGSCIIEIKDNGPGMDESVGKRVFEPFFTTKPVGVGTGLGLSVSYFIITENHDGRLDVESSPGKGTTFTIRIPIKPKGHYK